MLLDCDSTWAITSSHRPGISCPLLPSSLRGVFLTCILKNTWKLWSANPESFAQVQETGFSNFFIPYVSLLHDITSVFWYVTLYSPIDTTHVSGEHAASIFEDETSRSYRSYLCMGFCAAFTLIASILKMDVVLPKRQWTAARLHIREDSTFCVSLSLWRLKGDNTVWHVWACPAWDMSSVSCWFWTVLFILMAASKLRIQISWFPRRYFVAGDPRASYLDVRSTLAQVLPAIDVCSGHLVREEGLRKKRISLHFGNSLDAAMWCHVAGTSYLHFQDLFSS